MNQEGNSRIFHRPTLLAWESSDHTRGDGKKYSIIKCDYCGYEIFRKYEDGTEEGDASDYVCHQGNDCHSRCVPKPPPGPDGGGRPVSNDNSLGDGSHRKVA